MLIEKNKTSLLIFVTLVLASLVSTAMVCVRLFYSGESRYVFLLWNLFLAWVPFLFSWLGYRLQSKLPLLLTFGSLWLLFLPNAPYLVTDFIHLRYLDGVPLWYDAIMIFSFALTGLLLGLLSLYFMQMAVTQRTGRFKGWVFVLFVLGLTGFGVYVGRFLRWNSWDVFYHPFRVAYEMLVSLVHPRMALKTVTVSSLLSAIFTFSYLVLLSLPRLVSEAQRN